MKSKFLFLVAVLSVFGVGCQSRKDPDVTQNFVTEKSELPQKIGDDKNTFVVTTQDALLSTKSDSQNLILGYPLELIGQENFFGMVITEVSDHENEDSGGLKMSGLSPMSVRTVLQKTDDGKQLLNLKGCEKKCNETAEIKTLFSIPVLSIDEKAKLAYLDISSLGQTIDVLQTMPGMIDPNAPWKFTKAWARSFDYSLSTLVIDVVSQYEVPTAEKDKTKTVELTSRVYLKLSSIQSPYFEKREATPEVGYFLTERAEKEWITRFPAVSATSGPIKYYLKNIPERYKAGFIDAFESWNTKMNPVFGARFLDYEFLDANDVRNQVIVAGDIRYNVVEWDLINQASYGGLGPSIAHQGTGEILAAQVLIQGPMVEKLYKDWFQVKTDKDVLALQKKYSTRKGKSTFEMKMGSIKTYIPSQDPRLHDPREIRMDFEKPPEGYDYDTYMKGYFRDMVAHELGHNLGLRHNFRGNLADNGSRTLGSVSRSIMEYLGGMFRHLDDVGEYDVMAISYGYLGKKPTHADWYCTDEDSGNSAMSSAECSSNDATNDPFSYFQRILNLALTKAVNSGSATAPDWTAEDLGGKLGWSVSGLARYASSALLTANQWTNFFGKADRPTDKLDVPDYVLKAMNNSICNADYDKAIQTKESDEAKAQTEKNLKAVRAVIAKTLVGFQKPFQIATPENFPCLDFSALNVAPTPVP